MEVEGAVAEPDEERPGERIAQWQLEVKAILEKADNATQFGLAEPRTA
jgi:hypothetical protein